MAASDGWLLPDPATAAANAAGTAGGRWVSRQVLKAAAAAGKLECGGQEVQWLRMWQREEDEDGEAVTRSYGLPSADVKKYAYNQAWLVSSRSGCFSTAVAAVRFRSPRLRALQSLSAPRH